MFEIYGNLCLLLSSFGLHKVKGEKKRKVRVDGQKPFAIHVHSTLALRTSRYGNPAIADKSQSPSVIIDSLLRNGDTSMFFAMADT